MKRRKMARSATAGSYTHLDVYKRQDYDRIPRTDWETKTNTDFATGDAPDLTTGGKEVNYKGWAEDEMLVPVADSLEDLRQKMPNYCKLFGENMEDVYNLASSADGKLYYIPSVRQERCV